MAGKTLRAYRDQIRDLRRAGFDSFGAGNGYKLRGRLTAGQKAAITRAHSANSRSIAAYKGWETRRAHAQARPIERGPSPADTFERTAQVQAEEIYSDNLAYYDDAYGDEFEGWDEIDFFDWNEYDDFVDEETDQYEEASG